MYCVIQEIEVKKVKIGYPKELQSIYYEGIVNGKNIRIYSLIYSDERFERTIKKSYKVTLHESCRVNGKVKKNQYSLFTVNYYDIAEGWFTVYDYCNRKIESLSKANGLSINLIYDLIDAKTDLLIKTVQDEFYKTEEYKTHKLHEDLKYNYADKKDKFSKKYNCDRSYYDQAYDGFGKLINKERLEEIKAEYKAQQEYEEKSRSYQENFHSNYSKYFGTSGSSYFNNSSSNYTEGDKESLKQFYRVLSKKFHPDSNPDKDTSKEMKLLNELKSQWGI